jgi:hypothetical protein
MKDQMKPRTRKKKQNPVVTLDSLLAQNPHLDRDRIQRRLTASHTKRAGAKRRGYTLGAPYTQRRVSVARDATDRTIILGRKFA